MIASVATAARYDSAACDGGRFISPEERASAPLGLSAQRSTEGLSPRREGGGTNEASVTLRKYAQYTRNKSVGIRDISGS